jgi:hypothetical protein
VSAADWRWQRKGQREVNQPPSEPFVSTTLFEDQKETVEVDSSADRHFDRAA